MLEDKRDLIDIIEETVEEPDFKFSTYLERGFEICNEFAIGFILFMLLYSFISELISRIPLVGGTINQLFLSPIIMIGISLVAKRISKKEGHHFDNFWGGFKFILPLVMVSLIQSAILLIIISPIFITGDFNLWQEWIVAWSENPLAVTEFPNFRTWYFLLLIPIIYLTVNWIYASLFVVFHNLQAWEALEASRKIVSRNWATFAIFYLLTGIISISGVLLFGIGMLYTMPLGACIVYASFEDISEFYIGKEDDEDDMMKHLIDAF